jgi:hypothetical protein
MKRTLTLIAGCFVLASFCAVAQEGAPAGAAKKPESAPAAKPEPLDPAAEAMIQTLSKKIADAQPLVRDMAVAALERAGKAALPTLNAIASGSDKALAEAAKKLVERINRGPGFANQRNAGNPFGPERIDQLAKEMGLDEKKSQKLKDLHKATTDKMRDTWESVAAGDLTREEAREEVTQAFDDAKKELRKFMSEDEAKKVEESLFRRQGGGMGGGMRRGGGEGGGGDRRRPPGGGGGQDQ